MTTSRRRPGLSRKGWERLLDQDPFGRVRTDAELAELVLQAARHSPTPYALLLTALLGRPGLAEPAARTRWGRVVDHRRDLARLLGRPVHLRVAALDLAIAERDSSPPLVLDRGLVRSLVTDATTDPLTGLANRRQLLTVLEHELRQRRRPMVAVLDVDGFKQVNDMHGHARGDEVLRGLSGILAATLRKGDMAARLGGDEFGLVLVEATRRTAEAVLERVETAFGRAFGALGVGLSAGLAAGGEGQSAADTLEEADREMYAAKRRRGATRAAAAPPVAALYATSLPERLLAFHQALARLGVLLLPARTAEVARRLAPILKPRLILADLMLPPRGGADLLRELGLADAEARRALVAPERWRGVRRTAPMGLDVLTFPPAAAELERLVRALAQGALPPRARLASAAEAAEVLGVVEQLARGDVAPGLAEVARRLPDVDHLRRLLGA